MQEVKNKDSVGVCPHCGYQLNQMKAVLYQMQPFTILAGKYLIGKVIGEGGFGITYLGLDLNLDLVVAIKEFYPNGFVTRESTVTAMVSIYAGKNEKDVNKWREGFINEARNLAKFSNLNGIVEVRDFFNENGTAYIVMEYIDGITLKQYLKQNGGKIPADKTFEMMEPVIRSLSKVHNAGMIHRDISPDNIMITKYSGMKLLDFGAAREFAGNAEKSLSIMLKPGYAPEEQYRSRGKQGPWSDVYALTATIYKCITGVTPAESMERLREDTLKSPKDLGIGISDAQNAAIMQGMAVYAENRFQNMDALHVALYSNEGAMKVVGTLEIQSGSGQSRLDIKDAENQDKKSPGTYVIDQRTILIAAAVVCGIFLICLCAVFMPKKPDSVYKADEPFYSDESVYNITQISENIMDGDLTSGWMEVISSQEVEESVIIEPDSTDRADEKSFVEDITVIQDVLQISSAKIRDADASSYLEESAYNIVHMPGKAIDGDLTTGWVEGVSGQGIGETITVYFDGAYLVSGIEIYAGYQKSDDLYHKNSRPKEVYIAFSDGSGESHILNDVNNVQNIQFIDSVITESISLRIDSVYPGNKYEDTVITEISPY